MQVANFEYTDQSYTLKLVAITVLTLIILLIVLMSTQIIGMIAGLLVPFAVAFAIFWYGKRKIRKNGTVVINESYADFKLEGKDVKLMYSDIKFYQVERFNGPNLLVRFNDGTKFRLSANVNFSNYLYLSNVLDALEKAIVAYQSTHNVSIERKPSIFERKWMLPLLIVLTIAIGLVIVSSIAGGKPLQTSFYSSIVFLIVLWGGWATRRKEK